MSSNRVMRGELPKLWLALITVALGSASAGGTCERGQSWWDRTRGACIPCTKCDHTLQLVVKYPCELHRDTICQSLTEIHIRPFSTTIDSKDDSSDYEYYEDVDSEVTASEVKWDLQTSTLTMAASGCIVFFIVVLFLSLSHAKQWKVLKQALTSDVQELSAKLKLMEAGGEAPEPLVGPDHHIYSNINIQVTKEALIGSDGSKKGRGNVYTQEKHTP